VLLHENQLHENQLHENQLHENQLHENQLHENQLHENQLHENQLNIPVKQGMASTSINICVESALSFIFFLLIIYLSK